MNRCLGYHPRWFLEQGTSKASCRCGAAWSTAGDEWAHALLHRECGNRGKELDSWAAEKTQSDKRLKQDAGCKQAA